MKRKWCRHIKTLAKLEKSQSAIKIILGDFQLHNESIGNYSEGEYTQDYTTRKELLEKAITH